MALPAVVIPPAVASLPVYLSDILSGLVEGAVFAILAMGVVVIYRTTRTLNLAQGGMATLGAFTYIALRAHGFSTPVAAVIVLAIGAAIGAGIGQAVAWPLRRASPTVKLVASLGILLMTQSITAMVFGNVPRAAPPLVSAGSVEVAGVRVASDGLVVLVVAALVAVAIGRVFRDTRFGLFMRAVAADPGAAALQGVNVRLVTVGSWTVGVALALGAGVLLGPVVIVVAPFLLTLVALQALGATLLGRIESLVGALVGGLVLGELVTFAQVLFPSTQGNGDIAVFLFILAILVVQRQVGPLAERA